MGSTVPPIIDLTSASTSAAESGVAFVECPREVETRKDVLTTQWRTLRGSWARTVAPALVACVIVLAPDVAPGTVAEQRARLPPPAHCNDPVEGIWKSHEFHHGYREWAMFTLEIHRDPLEPTRLTGSMINRSWYGVADEPEPGNCMGELDYMVSMNARGTYDEESGFIRFGGTDWRLDAVFCGSAAGFGYNLDVFSGTIDPEIMEFQSLANDGGRYVNVPMVFRRIGCFEDTPPARVHIEPPPLFPESSGCARGRQ